MKKRGSNYTFIHLTDILEVDPQEKYGIPLQLSFFKDKVPVDPNYVRIKKGQMVFAWSEDCCLDLCISLGHWHSFQIPEWVRVEKGQVQFPEAIIEHKPIMLYHYGLPKWFSE